MTEVRFQASAPGSLVLMGEYAVLEGGPALMMTVPFRLSVVLEIHTDQPDRLEVISDREPVFQGRCSGAGPDEPGHVRMIRQVLALLVADHSLCPGGLVFRISSTIDPTTGFGSSAALMASVLKVVAGAFCPALPLPDLFRTGRQALQNLYGYGSGADILAALADTPLAVVDVQAGTARPFTLGWQVSALYSGYKTPTPRVLEHVARHTSPEVWKDVVAAMKALTHQFLETRSPGCILAFQKQMERLGVLCPALRQGLELLAAPGRYVKISGSGLGDCLVVFSEEPVEALESLPEGFRFFPASVLMCSA